MTEKSHQSIQYKLNGNELNKRFAITKYKLQLQQQQPPLVLSCLVMDGMAKMIESPKNFIAALDALKNLGIHDNLLADFNDPGFKFDEIAGNLDRNNGLINMY